MGRRGASALTGLTAVAGALLVFRAFTGAGHRFVLVCGVALLVLAWGLAGRRRLALYLLVSAALAVGLFAAHHHPMRAVVAAGVVGAVIPLRERFPTRPDPHRLRTAASLLGALAGVVVIEAAWHIALQRQRPGDAGRAIASGFAVLPGNASATDRTAATVVTVGLLAALIVLFAAAPSPPPGTAAERALVAALAARPGADSLAPFATRADRTYAFSPDGDAAIGYRVVLGTALAAGDPVGDPVAGEAAVAEFLAECSLRGWRPAVLGCGDGWEPRWRALGWTGIGIGDEAVLRLDSFSLATRRMRNLRQAVQRSRNAGIRVVVGRLDGRLADALAPVLADWLGGRPERGFAMNLDGVLTPRPDCLVAVAYAADGVPVAFARFAVCNAGRTLTLDVAPRRREAANGVVERMIVEVAQYAADHGAAEVSLNFAGFREVFESRAPVARGIAATLHAFDRWIELAPLFRFTSKFHPRWRPRRLMLRSWSELVWVAAAALRAEFGRPSATVPGELPEASPAMTRSRPS
jgi:lysylphosphatidylglycerol synthetase-like protein (DUF2156 family)